MAHHDVKVDPIAKIVTAVGVVLILIAVGYMVKSLLNTIDSNSTKGEVVVAPTAPAAPAAAVSATAPAAATSAGDVAAGKAKYATCAACHGANGEGGGAFPKLAGLSAADAEGKLKKYRAGEQVGAQTALMAPNAAGLSDAEIANLAAFIASLGGAAPVAVASTAPATGSGDAAAGKAKYATCAACHGANGEGGGAFPKLAGLSAADAEGKLKKYRAGEQVGAQTALMAPNATGLSDADIANLAAHIAGMGTGGAAAAPAAQATAAPVAEVDKAVLARGQAIYTTCALCHGSEEAKVSRLLNAPLLPGHPASAVNALMKMYREGKAVGPNSSFMFPVAQGLDEEDTAAVAAYIGTLKH
ncbi:MAG: c-type cytochrome [Pseudomonadota bacterium]